LASRTTARWTQGGQRGGGAWRVEAPRVDLQIVQAAAQQGALGGPQRARGRRRQGPAVCRAAAAAGRPQTWLRWRLPEPAACSAPPAPAP
jgi:hypothetical protein